MTPSPATAPPIDAAAQAVLDFWFGPDERARPEWFRKDPAFDALIRERFEPLVEQALGRALDAWAASPRGALALIVLLDQFPRNLWRDTPRAFAGDALALPLARDLVRSGAHRQLGGWQRAFVYLPFEHAEDEQAQQESLQLFAALAAERPDLADLLDWAQRHAAVIARFGRYPHRNAILGRPSTAEEAAFLLEPGSRF